jgi:hypothetical protein
LRKLFDETLIEQVFTVEEYAFDALELARILAPQGRLYITVPIGRPRVCFNAHRVFAPRDIPTLLTGLQLTHFSWVDDAGLFHDAADPADAIDQDYACGFYELTGITNA